MLTSESLALYNSKCKLKSTLCSWETAFRKKWWFDEQAFTLYKIFSCNFVALYCSTFNCVFSSEQNLVVLVKV